MPVAAVTRLRLRPDAQRASFLWLSFLSWWQARWASGNIHARIRRVSDTEYWTLTVWQRPDHLQDFVTNGSHRTAMPKLGKWCDESSSARWDLEEGTCPNWETAAFNLGRHGRIHRVLKPSAAQAAGLPLGSLSKHEPVR